MQQFKVGPYTAADGSPIDARAGRAGDLIVSKLQPDYYEATFRKAGFHGANSGGVTTSVGLATTYVGLCLSNPPGSGMNLVLDKVGWAALVAWAAASAVGIMTGYHASTEVTHTTALAPKSRFVGQPVGVGKLDSAATLPAAPTLAMLLGAGLTGAITTLPQVGPNVVDLHGSIILPPGAFAALYTSTASGASGFLGSFSWTEVPA